MTGYYDLVLGVIPVALFGIPTLLSTLGLSLTTALPVGSVAAIGVIGHAMFVNGPVDLDSEGPDRIDPN